MTGNDGHTFESAREMKPMIDLPADRGRTSRRIFGILLADDHVAFGQRPFDCVERDLFERIADQLVV